LMSFSYFANVYPIEIITTEFSLLMSYMQFCLIIGFGQQPVKDRVKRKNTSPMQKICFFRLTLDGFVKRWRQATH